MPNGLSRPPRLLLFRSEHPRIRFDEGSHKYFIDSIPTFKSFSGLFELTIEPFKPMAKALKMAKQQEGVGAASDILASWEFDTVTGSVSHKYLELWAKGRFDNAEFQKSDSVVRNAVNSILKQLKEFLSKGWKIVGSEVQLPDYQSHCCGTVDLILQSTRNKLQFVIIDFKTTLKVDLREKLTVQGSKSLNIANTKLNQYAIQLHLYRNQFINLLDIGAVQNHTPGTTITLDNYDPQRWRKKLELDVKVMILTPKSLFDCSTAEFERFPSLAAKLLRNYSEIGQQIRISERFCLKMDEINPIPASFQYIRQRDPSVHYNLQYLLSASPVFSGMVTATEPMLAHLIPSISIGDLSEIFPSDHYCVPHHSTTIKRAETVFKADDQRLRICVENDPTNSKFHIYIAAIGTSSRGSGKKNSIICFTVCETGITYTSLCSCILGFCESCAHRARILLQIISVPSSPEFSVKSENMRMTLLKRQRLLKDNIGSKIDKSNKRLRQEHGIESSLHRFLSERTQIPKKLTKNHLRDIMANMKHEYQNISSNHSSPIRWPSSITSRDQLLSELLSICEKYFRTDDVSPSESSDVENS